MLMKLSKDKAESMISRIYELRFVRLQIHVNGHAGAIWVYLGRNSDYVIIPGVFCSCKDYVIRTIINKTSSFCKHQAGLYIALKESKYVVVNVDFEEAYRIIQEIIDKGISQSLRKKLK